MLNFLQIPREDEEGKQDLCKAQMIKDQTKNR